MRKEEVGAASRAESDVRDIFRGNSGTEQLAAVGLGQVEEDLLGQFTVSGSARGQKQQRIFFADLARLFGNAEETASVGELGLKGVPDFFADLIAATANAGTDCGVNILRAGAEVPSHFANTLFHDALDSTAPSGMENAYGLAPGVGKNYWEAVGGQHREKNSWSVRNQAVAHQRLWQDPRDAMDKV